MLICCAFKNGEDPKILGILGYPINGYIPPRYFCIFFKSHSDSQILLVSACKGGW